MGKTYKDMQKSQRKNAQKQPKKPSNISVADWMESDDAKGWE